MARMFRPSRPMMRPFISSLGRGTTETVASATWSAAQRWMAREIYSGLLIRFFLIPRLNLLDLHGRLMRDLGFKVFNQIRFRLFHRVPRDFLEHFKLAAFDRGDFVIGFFKIGQFSVKVFRFLFQRIRLLVERFFLLLEPALLFLEFGPPFTDLPFQSLRLLWISSLASKRASRFLLSAALMESLMILFAFSSALCISRSDTFFR
jgi:hypothetical protein